MKLQKNARVYVAGHRGLVGSAIWREALRQGFTQLIGRTHAELDLLDAEAVRAFYAKEKPEFVFVAAAKVGGILANNNHRAIPLRNVEIQTT
jgi:GDP-L-fucose synthase